jgi:hypothetical protein
MITLLNVELTNALPLASTFTTFFFAVLALLDADVAIMINYILVAFFLLATVLRFPLRVRQFVRVR